MHLKTFCAFLLIAGIAASCGGDSGTPSETLVNPGFEDGKEGWAALTTEGWHPEFLLTTEVVHDGTTAAHLRMEPAGAEATRIFGVTQEVSPEEFPEQISGWYRVENWERETAIQYLQVVVIAWASENAPPGLPNHQIRYILDGIGSPPFRIDNAKYIFLNTGDPREDEWMPFTMNVRQDFIEQWGAAPEDFEFVRLLFEVRYDGRTSGETPSADVYYDDLHFGEARSD